MRRALLIASPIVGLAALALAWAPARANHVQLEGTVDPSSPPSGVVIQTPPAPGAVTVYTPGTMPSSLQADDIKAHEVRAQTIYANKIEADNIQGVIHQTKGVKIKDSRGDIKSPQVSAAMIFAVWFQPVKRTVCRRA